MHTFYKSIDIFGNCNSWFTDIVFNNVTRQYTLAATSQVINRTRIRKSTYFIFISEAICNSCNEHDLTLCDLPHNYSVGVSSQKPTGNTSDFMESTYLTSPSYKASLIEFPECFKQ